MMGAKTAGGVSGLVGALGTAGGLTTATAGLAGPAAHLGGYATAQMVAGAIGVGGDPALSAGIVTIGGPLVAGILATGGVGLVLGGLAYGLYNLFE